MNENCKDETDDILTIKFSTRIVTIDNAFCHMIHIDRLLYILLYITAHDRLHIDRLLYMLLYITSSDTHYQTTFITIYRNIKLLFELIQTLLTMHFVT